MHITFEPAFTVLFILILHTVLTHVFNWIIRQVWDDPNSMNATVSFLLVGLLHLVELIAIYAFLTNNYLH